MPHYNLEPGEFELRLERYVKLDSNGETEPLEEIVLTNKHLILVGSTGVFQKRYFEKRCPLEDITRYQGEPQVTVVSIRDERVLHVPFEDETVSLVFSSNPSAAKKWADAIKQAAQGNIEGIAQKDAVVEQVSSLAEGARGIATALGGGLAGSIVGSIGAVVTSVAGNAPIDEKKPEPSKTSTSSRMICLGCHAPLSGQSGREVTCEYCGTTQTL